MDWTKESVSAEDVRRLYDLYAVDLIGSSILARRHIVSADDVKYYLESDSSILHNPFLFKEMVRFIERIRSAAEDHEKVCIFGDRDADGVTSTALLYRELQSMGIDVSFCLPDGDEPYGLSIEAVDKASSDKITLAITVDCGISNNAEIDYAKKKGIDTLVADHHLASGELPDAYAIVDPKLEDSGYPFSHLAACGVVVKCIWALRFSQTEWYNQEIAFLHAVPGNDTVVIEAAKMKNFIITERVTEEVVPGIIKANKSKVLNMLADAGCPVFVMDRNEELYLLSKAFPDGVDFALQDIRPLVEEALPVTRKKSLYTLTQNSRMAKYNPRGKNEFDTLTAIFTACVMASNPSLSKDYDKLFDLVAIGTIADLMPMIDENRILVKRGIQVIEEGRRKCLIPLLASHNLLSRRLTTSDISWNLTPLINAAGRLGKPQVAEKLLLCDNESDAAELATQLDALNRERQKMGEESWSRILPLAKKSMEQTGGKIVIVEDPYLERGLTGMIASRLLRQFKVPCIVIANLKDGRCTASLRSSESLNIRDFLSSYNDILLDYGGHACAGGLSIDADKLPELKKRILEDINYFDTEYSSGDSIQIDASIPKDYMTPDLIKLVELFEPYGEQNPPLNFLMEGATIEDIVLMGNNPVKGGASHVKLTLCYGKYRWPAVYWNAADRIGSDFQIGSTVDVVFRLSRNYFRTQENLQLTVIDMQRHRTR